MKTRGKQTLMFDATDSLVVECLAMYDAIGDRFTSESSMYAYIMRKGIASIKDRERRTNNEQFARDFSAAKSRHSN